MAKPYYLKKKFLRRKAEELLARFGYDTTHWTRVVAYRDCFAFLRSLGPEKLDALEISAGHAWREAIPFRSFRETHYPAYDVCAEPLAGRFDVVIADYVLPHVDQPARAVANMRAMLREGGHCIVTTSFLIRVDGSPNDCTRWTERGLLNLMVEGGFSPEVVRVGSWGNRACVKANFRGWAVYGFGIGKPLRNEPEFPVSVWAIARR